MGRFSTVSTPAQAPSPAATTAPEPEKAEAAPKAAPASENGNPAARHAKSLLDAKIRVHNRLIDELDLSSLDKLNDVDLRRQVRAIVMDIVREEGMAMSSAEIGTFADAVFDEMTGLGPLEPLLSDDSVSDILVNGCDQVYVERGGELGLSNVRFADNDHLLRILNRIVSAVGRRVDESQPLVDARLLDGSRVNAAISPIAIDGPLVSIRKFSKKPLTVEKLAEFGALPMPMLDFVVGAVKCRASTVISGGTGSGKTTLLNALSSAISLKERIITIEDAAELQLQQPHVARMETRPPNLEGKGEIRQRELVKNALRMRPDRVFLGEVRGEEAFDMLQAMNTGHEGSMATIHANNPRDALTRLEQMVLMGGMKISVEAIRGQIASAVNFIVQAARLSDGSRKVMSVAEIVGMEGSVIQLQEIFRFERTHTGDDGKVHGHFAATGIRPKFLDEMERRGVFVPPETFDPQRKF
ncbi:MAG: CpaF family protein [Pseudomonadota bacterium]